MNLPSAESGLSAADARAIAREGYIYGFPMAANYQSMHKQAVDTAGKDYKGPFNSLNSSKSVATPEDKFVVTPNSDTPYSFLWMDLRTEPVVVTMPRIEPNRYYRTTSLRRKSRMGPSTFNSAVATGRSPTACQSRPAGITWCASIAHAQRF